ncbi:MAG: DUF4097 family beta strand repeat protein [Clostridia bacterium]|nr:DUF4097 family beta strand repeat protein [Clostridia bacterium]
MKKIPVFIAIGCIVAGLLAAAVGLMLVDFDFLKLSPLRYDTKTYPLEEPFHSIDILTAEHDIILLPTEGECKLVCTESKQIFHAVEVENGTLTVRRVDNSRWYEHFGLFWHEELSVTLYMPAGEYEALVLKSVSGDVEVPDQFIFADIDLSSTSGNLFLGSASKGSLKLTTVSGNIEGVNTVAATLSANSTSGCISLSSLTAETLDLHSVSGELRLSRLTAGSITAKTTSGDVFLRDLQAESAAQLTTVSGNIQLEDADAGSFETKTISGDIEGSIRSPKNFITDTTSGDFHLPASDPAAGSFSIKTTSGDATITLHQ